MWPVQATSDSSIGHDPACAAISFLTFMTFLAVLSIMSSVDYEQPFVNGCISVSSQWHPSCAPQKI